MNSNQSSIPALSLKDINFRVSENFALTNIGFSVPSGKVCILLGANGAGKSTLFSIASGLFHADKGGEVLLGGVDLYKDAQQALARLGVVFQQSTLDLDLTVKQNLLYHASLHAIAPKDALVRIERDLEHNGLIRYLNTRTGTLSGGERRRVELVRALMHEPLLLLMDEATSGLDISRRLTFIEDVRTLCRDRGVGVLWATHLGDEVGLEDNVVVLDNGAVIENGEAKDLLKKAKVDSIEALYSELIGRP